MALVLYIGIFIFVLAFCKYWLRYSHINILIPIVILNTVPLTSFPGSLTSMYAVDLVFPIVAFYIFFNLKNIEFKNRYLKVSFWLFVVIPCVSLMLSLLRWQPETSAWITYLYHKVVIFTYILFCFLIYKKIDLRELLNAATLYWTCLCIISIGHYLGYYYADIITSEEQVDANIFYNSWQIQGGVMGLNRGAIGVFAATFLSFALSKILYYSNFNKGEKLIYILCCLFSLMIFFLSGSRSGLVSALGANTIIFFFSLVRKQRLNVKFLMPIIIGIVAFLFYISSTSLLDRFSFSASEDSGTDRLEVQLLVFDNSLSDFQSFFIGNGARPFSHLGDYLTHPHSDYFQVLWDYGWVGVIIYFCFLKMIFNQLKKLIFSENFSILAAFFAALIGGLTIGNLMIGTSRMFVYICFMVTIYTIAYLKNMTHGRKV